mgnify:CR=1 FL=1
MCPDTGQDGLSGVTFLLEPQPSPMNAPEPITIMPAASTITVTRNEILYGLNQLDKFILAIVLVDGEQHEGPFYVTKPFTQEPDWAVTSINLDLDQLLARAERV